MTRKDFKSAVAAFSTALLVSLPATAQTEATDVESLLRRLAQAESETAAERLERQVITEWSKSGSATMDLLLRRGQDALERGEFDLASEHFGALTDHAPDFAEGWLGLAQAYYGDERFGPAMDALERALAIEPRHFGALRGVGAIHEQVDRPALAYRAYERVLELRPHDAEVQQALERLEMQVRGIAL
ncbi:Tetratricopeptide repeat-containing protein [Citreimonas salinaria]|uniref:Tetratricopeptide repeat-containing protein n=1 Tax=Citreimonas salinaria TaxID=321339 RepID=A0A1H3NN84_9RHOB|nr:Tetratricopeptide repeat-containing protein [Citreimonas salinaria]